MSVLLHILAVFNFALEQGEESYKLESKKKLKVTRIIIRPKKRMQVVDTLASTEKNRPKDARFYGKDDQSFKKQTIEKRVGAYRPAAKGAMQASLSPSITSPQPKSNYKRFKRSRKNSKISLKDLMFNQQDRKKLDALANTAQVPLGIKNGDSAAKGLGSRSDHVEDIPLSDLTQLNTSKYRFHSFLTRFKKQMEGHWRLSVRKYAEKGSFARMPASRGQKTGLVIILDGRGDVVNISIERSCGIEELDKIAVNAIYKAGSFPNPPKDMVSNNRVEIPFGFVVD
ncbi:MAG: energy transducer TonB [Bacteriovoracaceae bacterium]|nr:energy transducer TonB [Bacteriovoracaceae bacterium]